MGVSMCSVCVRGTVEYQLPRTVDGNIWLQWGTFSIYPNASNTCFRQLAYSREMQRGPGEPRVHAHWDSEENACCPVLEAERPVLVFANTVTEMNMLSSDITSKFLSLVMLFILFQGNLTF